MNYFSGFCLKDEKTLFKEYLEEKEFVVAGFSRGAQKALNFALNSKKRIDKIQLLSPAFFQVNQKFIDVNLNAFKKDKNSYIKNFLKKAGAQVENGYCKVGDEIIQIDYSCNEFELLEMFIFKWEKIEELKNVKIEVFLGEFDKILALKKAYEFFKNYADVYFIKKANHFLRS